MPESYHLTPESLASLFIKLRADGHLGAMV